MWAKRIIVPASTPGSIVPWNYDYSREHIPCSSCNSRKSIVKSALQAPVSNSSEYSSQKLTVSYSHNYVLQQLLMDVYKWCWKPTQRVYMLNKWLFQHTLAWATTSVILNIPALPWKCIVVVYVHDMAIMVSHVNSDVT